MRCADDPRVYHARPLIFAICLCAGAATYLLPPFEPSVWALIGVFAVVQVLLIMALRHAGSIMALVAICIYAAVCGLGVAKLRTVTTAHTMIAAEMGPVMIEGWISAVEPASRGVRLRLDVHAIEGLSRPQTPRHIRITHISELKMYPGRFVRCWAVLRPPPSQSVPGDYNFRRQAWFSGLDAVGYVQGRCRGGALGMPDNSALKRKLEIAIMRRGLAEHVVSASGDRAGGFAAALVSGDRSYISEADQEALRGAGLAHLLAISGLHMGIIGGLIYALLFRAMARIEWLALRVPIQKPAAIAGLVASCIYLVISGASVSTQRAFIMTALVFIALLIDRQAISLRTLAIAMIVIVCLQPESVLAPGFQMSFAATGCLIATYEAWQKRRQGTPQGWFAKPSFALQSLFVTSVVAAAATAPFALYHFDRVAPFGLLANVLAMPIITFVSAPAAALSLVLTPFGLSDIGLRIFGASLEAVLWVAHTCSALGEGEGAPLKSMPGAALFAFSASIASTWLLTGAARRRAVAGLCAIGAAIWTVGAQPDAYWAPSGDVYVKQDGRGYQKVAFIDGDGLSPLGFKGMPDLAACNGPRCLVETQNGPLLLVNAEGVAGLCADKPENLLALVPATQFEQTCPNTYSYSDISQTGGIAISLSGRAPRITQSSKCGARPWQDTCAPPERGGQNQS